MAEQADSPWFKHIDLIKGQVGKEQYCIVKSGVRIEKYGITIPKELEEQEKIVWAASSAFTEL